MGALGGGGDKRHGWRGKGAVSVGGFMTEGGDRRRKVPPINPKQYFVVIPDGWPDLIGPQIRDPDAQCLVRQRRGGGVLNESELDDWRHVWVPDLRPDRFASGHPSGMTRNRIRVKIAE